MCVLARDIKHKTMARDTVDIKLTVRVESVPPDVGGRSRFEDLVEGVQQDAIILVDAAPELQDPFNDRIHVVDVVERHTFTTVPERAKRFHDHLQWGKKSIHLNRLMPFLRHCEPLTLHRLFCHQATKEFTNIFKPLVLCVQFYRKLF